MTRVPGTRFCFPERRSIYETPKRGRFKNLSPDAYKSWDIVSVGVRRRKEGRQERRRKTMAAVSKISRASSSLFPMVDACACYGHHAALLLSGRGEMITTPNRLRGERSSTDACVSEGSERVARVDKEVADEWKGFSNWSRNGLFLGPGSRVRFVVPLSDLFEEPPRRRRAARLETKRLVCLSSSLPPIAALPLCLSLPSFAIPPRHALSLSLLLCFCNLFVSASSVFLFSSSSSSVSSPPSSLLLRSSVRRCWFVRESSASYRTSLAHTPACRCISLAGERCCSVLRDPWALVRTCDTRFLPVFCQRQAGINPRERES